MFKTFVARIMPKGMAVSLERGRRMPIARACAIALLAGSLGACSSFDMFSKKDDVASDEPADRLYNEGLYLLNAKQDPKQAVKKFEEVDRQHPYSEWARKSLIMTSYAYYQAGEYDDCVTAAKRYITLHPGSAGRRLCAIPDRLVLFRRNSRHHARPGAHRKGARRARRSHPQISRQRIRRSAPRRKSRSRATSLPARKWRSAATI